MKTKGILQPILVRIAIGCCVARGAELPATHLSLQRTDRPAFVLPGVQIHSDVLSPKTHIGYALPRMPAVLQSAIHQPIKGYQLESPHGPVSWHNSTEAAERSNADAMRAYQQRCEKLISSPNATPTPSLYRSPIQQAFETLRR